MTPAPSAHLLRLLRLAVAGLTCLAFSALAQNHPPPKEATWVAKDFRFHTGQSCLKCASTT
ncbi:hypothetical protein HK414_19700 [Ramlibacter terrae]|uniref:Uncharacterized protein n=1 Tax=Ramlibacter terrae TaxID=2732511 RepID=A0ABX6P4B9_9BURK|nr:hypothetical protein HK414_19700 [Ramlibacter terrae]